LDLEKTTPSTSAIKNLNYQKKMIQKITKGIRIAVKTKFEGTFYNQNSLNYSFSYKITIENKSKSTVQLDRRKWIIKDALNHTEIVEGEGVIGEQPILRPGEIHYYRSGCILTAPLGSMKGNYTMLDFKDSSFFEVAIPSFKLSAPFVIN
jgi:ApaG protein